MTTERTQTLVRLTALDAVLLTAACLVPAASHVLALPLYMLNPMLAILLTGMLVGRDWRNSLVLAVLLPAVSCLVTGMPAADKMVCMMAELATVAGLFGWLKDRMGATFAVFAAIVAGKVVYYALKAVVVAPAVLVGTDWKVQLLAVLLWGGLFAMLYKRLK